jgi:hypothetical protein
VLTLYSIYSSAQREFRKLEYLESVLVTGEAILLSKLILESNIY